MLRDLCLGCVHLHFLKGKSVSQEYIVMHFFVKCSSVKVLN